MKKLIDITSLEQIKVGDMLTSDLGENKRKVLAKIDLIVVLSYSSNHNDCASYPLTLKNLITNGYKQEVEDTPWQPKEGENYYYPNISNGVADYSGTKYCPDSWAIDKQRLAIGLCFRTPEEATAAAQRMLDVLKPKQDDLTKNNNELTRL